MNNMPFNSQKPIKISLIRERSIAKSKLACLADVLMALDVCEAG
jgi:hypothetical protein